MRRTAMNQSGEDDSCVICFGEEGDCDVYFSPCSHKACKACVMKLRVANVYKADKGVRCPICRQVIEGYLDAPVRAETGSWSEKERLVVEEKPEPLNTYGRLRITSIGNVNDYVPPKGPTGGLKMNFRQDELHPGYVVPPLKPDSDVLAMAMDKTGARHLDHMLREGYVKRHKVAKICREILTPFAARLALHGCANFVLQRMLDYAAEHRGDAGNSECFFTAIVRSFCRDGIVSAAKDSRGTFSAQKMLLLMQGIEEVKLVIKALTGSMVLLSLHQYGVYVIQRLVEALITSMNCPPGQKPRVPPNEAVKCLALVSAELTSNPNDAIKIGIHQSSGPMLVECIRWSLPETESLQAAMVLATHSKQLSTSRYGNRTLLGLLSLDLKEVADAIINSLEGAFVHVTLDFFSWGWKLVRSCLATRCVDDSSRMLIVDELLDSLYNPSTQMRVVDTQFGCDTLAFGLAISTRRCLDERLDKLQDCLSPLKFQRLKESTDVMRSSLFLDSPAAAQMTIEFRKEETDSNDPWTDDEPSNNLTKAISEGSLSELSVEANSDWEQLAGSDDAETSARTYTPPHLRDLPDAIPDASSTSANHVVEVQSSAAPLLPPAVKTGTYAPPHVRQALGIAGATSTLQTAKEHPTAAKAGGSFGVIGSQRERRSASNCVVCESRDVATVLLDCSHMCCCMPCSYQVSYCPVCQSPVRQVVEVKPFANSTTAPVSAVPSTNLPYATDLLPSDLFQTISLNCELPNAAAAAAAAVAADGLPDLDACALLLGGSSSNGSSGSSSSYASSKYSFAQPEPVSTKVAAPRRPYRPPDVFR